MREIEKFARPLLAKYLTRALMWIAVTVLGSLTAEVEGAVATTALGASTLIVAIGAYLIDSWHHRRDLAEKPK